MTPPKSAASLAETYAKSNTIFEDEYSNDVRAFLAGHAAGLAEAGELVRVLAQSFARQLEWEEKKKASKP